MKTLFLFLLVLIISACAAYDSQLKGKSSGLVGCPPSRIVIEDDESGLTGHTWTAICNGKKFYCRESVTDAPVCKQAIE
ncbi:MAG: hypothetical protein ABR911_14285 [Syntrophales bacterium]